jgi:hypothetical protein
MPSESMDDEWNHGREATFEHANKRGAGKQNDSIAPATGNCAVHGLCNGAVGSERVL